MSRTLRACLLAVCLLGLVQVARVPAFGANPPAEKAASRSEEPKVSHELLFDTINFILLVGVLVYLYRKRGRAFFNERSDSIRRSLEESRQALEKSQARLAEAENKLDGLQDEVRALKERAEAEIADEQERMRRASDEEAGRIEEFAKAQIQAAASAAKLELKDYVVEQALQQARGMIQERMNEQNRERLVSFFLDELNTKLKSN